MEDDYILVVGSLTYEIRFQQERLPNRCETLYAHSVSVGSGGTGVNQAVQCAKLGAKTILAGKVGQDYFGDELLKEISGYGVDTSCIGRSVDMTGVGCLNLTDNGETHVTISQGANYSITLADAHSLQQLVAGAKVLVLQLEIPEPAVECLIDMASEAGVYIVLNASPARAIRREALEKVDAFIVNEVEATYYFDQGIRTVSSVLHHYKDMLDQLGGCLIVTLGDEGAVLCTEGGCVSQPPMKLGPVVATAGAGDSFTGAYAYGIFKGMKEQEAFTYAAKAAALYITKVGTLNAMPTKAQMDMH